jgi:hypothetical protein
VNERRNRASEDCAARDHTHVDNEGNGIAAWRGEPIRVLLAQSLALLHNCDTLAL